MPHILEHLQAYPKEYNETRSVTALSVGGGMIEIIEIEEAVVSVKV